MTRRTRALLFALTLGAAAPVLVQGVAFAGDAKQEGEALNNEGRALSRAGKWEEARKKFEASYAKVGTPGVLFNLAWAEQNLGMHRAALKHYRLYLELPPTEKITAEARANAQKFAGECAAKLCTIEVRGASKVTIDGEAPSEREVGEHTVTMDGSQGPKSKSVSCAAGQTVVVEYEEKSAGTPPVVPVPSATTSGSVRPPDPPPVEGERGSWVLPGVLAGVGVVGLGVGIGLGAGSGSATSSGRTLFQAGACADLTAPLCATARDKESSAKTLSTGSVVGYVVGGGLLAAAAITALVIAPWKARETRAGLSFSPSVGGGTLQGTF
jgi:hypothetical protein